MSTKLFGELPLVSSNEQLTKVQEEHPLWDKSYVASGCIKERRRFFESLWNKYKPYADRHFLSQIKEHFSQRAWEMYVANVLLEKGITIQSKDEGPDCIVIDNAKKHILYLECIVPERGDSPDAVPHFISTPFPREPILQAVPQDKIMLRITTAIKAKFDQYQRWKDKEWFNKDAPYVIAINTGSFDYPDDSNIPYVPKVLFGVGHPYFSSDGEDEGWTFRDSIERLSGALVPVTYFMSSAFEDISGILFTNKSVGNIGKRALLIVNNPFARNPIEEDFLNLFDKWFSDRDKENVTVAKRRVHCGEASGSSDKAP